MRPRSQMTGMMKRIVLHGGFPLTILFIIPVIGLLVLRVINHRFVAPVTRLLIFRVWNLFRLQNLPIILDGTLINFLIIDLYAYGVVRLDYESVKVGGAFVLLLVRQIRLLQDVFAFIIEDQMRSFGVTTFIWAK